LTELWASPKDDYLPRRVRYLSSGRLVKQIDVTDFRKEPNGYVYPAEWKLTRYSASGVVTATRTITVREFVVNTTISDDEFTIQFPPGLRVEDVILHKYYLVRDDGSWMEFTPGEEDSESVRAGLHTPWWQRNWWLLLAGVVAGGVLLLGLLRWRRKRKTSAPSLPPT
jgi:hypothetical protein